jgi:serine/threonine protein kinase
MARDVVVKTGDLVEGRYRIIQTLGAGGMGTVFLAEHAMIKRRVAIKILHRDLATDGAIVEGFLDEARAAGTLGHPNIVESTDMGFLAEHVPYIVFEYLEGALLTDEIYRVGGLSVRRAVRIAAQIASALDAAHRAGIVHRDLKSDNIFLTDKDDALDHVKVLDFGVSRFLAGEERDRDRVVGTPEFMAPEQITCPAQVDRRADIYSLGVILYEMLTARRPFSIADDPRLLMHYIVAKPPPPLLRNEAPHALSAMILERLLAKDPGERYQTMGDVQAALETFITREGGTPVPRRSAPSLVQALAHEAETSIRLPARRSVARTTPAAFSSLDTPVAVGRISLPAAQPMKRPYALYGVAGAGILMGTIGLVVGLRGSERAPAPAPVVAQPAAAVASPARTVPSKIEVELGAEVPDARVVFRRRVQMAPVRMEINASDVVELVEISAPGHKTTRYWLTFDRPTYLNAQLRKGSGSYEATEEETLAALGEVIVVSGTAPAIAAGPVPASPVAGVARSLAVAPTEKTVEREPRAAAAGDARNVAMARRKIGRAAAPEAVTPPVAIVEASTQPADIAVPEPTPVPEPVPTRVGAPEPRAAIAEAPVEESLHIARPTIDRDTMASVIATHRPQVLKCFTDGKKKRPTMKGTLTLQLHVAASGAVQRVQVQSTLDNPLVAACVVRAAGTWRFPVRAGGETATVAYPFTFN